MNFFMTSTDLETTNMTLDDVNLHVKQAGPEDGEPILFLHGFPEYWYAWRNYLEDLANRGYRVIAPDQRGYNRSDKPPDIEDYKINLLVDDVVGLIDALGYDSVNIVGHDWGATIGWRLGETHPEKVSRMILLNSVHPGIFAKYIRSHPSQVLKSWYMFLFQLPWLPEFLLSMGGFIPLRFLLPSDEPTFHDGDVDRYVSAWERSGALGSMLNWYRASVRYSSDFDSKPTINCPVRLLWGEKDPYLRPELAQISSDRIDGVDLSLYPEQAHWLHHEVPDQVKSEIDSFLAS